VFAQVEAYSAGGDKPKIKEITVKVKAEPEKYFGELVRELAVGDMDDIQKIKNIHDWIVDNVSYDNEAYESGDFSATRYDACGVIQTGKTVCSGYARLFQAMCEEAGIECRTVSGHAKGAGYIQGEPYECVHAWNVVKVRGQWQLIDVTWDDCLSSYTYFMANPEAFIHDHFPEEPYWQLLEEPIGYEQYLSMADNPARVTKKETYSGLSCSFGYPEYHYNGQINLKPLPEWNAGLFLFRTSHEYVNAAIKLNYTRRSFMQDPDVYSDNPQYTKGTSLFHDPVSGDSALIGKFNMNCLGAEMQLIVQVPNRSHFYPYFILGGSVSTDLLYDGYPDYPDEFWVPQLGIVTEKNDANGQPYLGLAMVSRSYGFNQFMVGGIIGFGIDFSVGGKNHAPRKIFGMEFNYAMDILPIKDLSPAKAATGEMIPANPGLLKRTSFSLGLNLYF
jgi:hypothetical protein